MALRAFPRTALISAILALSAACSPHPVDGSPPEPTDGSGFRSASACPVLAPNELPDGAAPGEARLPADGSPSTFLHVWGKRGNQVTIGRGQEVLEHVGGDLGFPRTGGEPVVGTDGIRRWVIAVGDPPLGQVMYNYLIDACPYVLWTESGLTWTAALKYAARLATRITSGSDAVSLGPLTRCRDLPTVPPDVELDTTLDVEGGQLQYSYLGPGPGHETRTFTLDFANDPSCRARDDIFELINHALEAGEHPVLVR